MNLADVAGVRVNYSVAGPDDAPAVMLLHHFHGNVDTWRHVTAQLSATRRVVAFDRPGFGRTERPPRDSWRRGNPYTRATSARIAVGLLDHLGIDRAVLVGASAGGSIALETFARYPGRVAGLALISPAITGDAGPWAPLRPLLRTPAARVVGTAIARRKGRRLGMDRVARAWHDPSRATESDLEPYRRAIIQPGWAEAIYEALVAEPPPDLRTVLPRVDVPTLVVAGTSDRVVKPDWSRRTAAAIPTAQLALLDGVGHTPHEERPDLLLDVLVGFLDHAWPASSSTSSSPAPGES